MGIANIVDHAAFKLAYITYAAALTLHHMRYAHGREVAYSQRSIIVVLFADLVGFAATWLVLRHYRPESTWISWFLGIHALVHIGSVVWAISGWSSLASHMREFQNRRLSPVLGVAEFLFEQSDGMLYLVAAIIVAATLPVPLLLVAAIGLSALWAIGRPEASVAARPRP